MLKWRDAGFMLAKAKEVMERGELVSDAIVSALIVEAGGLSADVVRDIVSASLPSLPMAGGHRVRGMTGDDPGHGCRQPAAK